MPTRKKNVIDHRDRKNARAHEQWVMQKSARNAAQRKNRSVFPWPTDETHPEKVIPVLSMQGSALKKAAQ